MAKWQPKNSRNNIIIKDIIGCVPRKENHTSAGDFLGFSKFGYVLSRNNLALLCTRTCSFGYMDRKIEYQLNNALKCDIQQHQAADVIHPVIETDQVFLLHNFMIRK